MADKASVEAEAEVAAAAAARRWLGEAEADGAEVGCEELEAAVAALEGLEADGQLWEGLRPQPWARVRAVEGRLRARAAEGLARARHLGPRAEVEALLAGRPQADVIRPPWSADVPGRVAAAVAHVSSFSADPIARDPDVEALSTVDCQPTLCGPGLCWHCWHLAECDGRPPEVEEFLKHARSLSAHSAPGHRARLVEQRWGYLEVLAEATTDALGRLRGVAEPRVLVLGGAGVVAVVAARAGASVSVWEPNAFVAAAVRAGARANGVEGRISVVEKLEGALLMSELECAHVVVLEGLEPDGVLGCGALAQWLNIAEAFRQRATPGARHAPQTTVLPAALSFSAALAQTRLDAAAGVELELEPFADMYGGLAPLPQAPPATSPLGCPAAVHPRRTSGVAHIVRLDLGAARHGDASQHSEGEVEVVLTAAAGSRPDAILVQCSARIATQEPPLWVFENVHALPARLSAAECETEVVLRCSWNVHRLWFELRDPSRFSAPPLARAHLLHWYSEMMNDSPRNTAFAAGLLEAVKKAKAATGRCRVADLGCGAGVLAALALRAGADEVLGVELTPHLARCARRVLARTPPAVGSASGPAPTAGASAAPTLSASAASVLCADIRAVSRNEEADRFDVVVAELLDAGGLGEKIVPFMRHARSQLLRSAGGVVVPRLVRVCAALVDVRLPRLAGVDLAAFQAFWLPARVSAAEWLALDLDGPLQWTSATERIEVFSIDFEAPQSEIAAALCERDLRFPLVAGCSAPQALATPARCNAIAWWFEAAVTQGGPLLSSAPRAFRPAGAERTHWAQAVSGLGSWEFVDPDVRAVWLRVRTDGVNLTWTPLGAECASLGAEAGPAAALRPLLAADPSSMASQDVEAWRELGLRATEGLRSMRSGADEMGDFARLQALQAAVLHLAAQPGLFGLETTFDAVAKLLKDFFT